MPGRVNVARRLVRTIGSGALRFTKALLGLAIVTALGFPAPAAAGSVDASLQASRAATPKATDVTVTISTENSGIWPLGADLDATITLSNAGPGMVPAGQVAVSITDSAFSSRADLDAWLHPGKSQGIDLGRVIAHARAPQVQPGESITLPPVTLPASAISAVSKGDEQVRGLALKLTVNDDVVSTGRGSVVLYSGSGAGDARVAVIMPLTTPPSAAPLLSKSDLTKYTAPDGILSRQLDGLVSDNVAIGIDPRIIASIRALGTSAPDTAWQWLDRLRLLPNEIFPLRYGDADPAAQAQSGLSKLLAPTSLRYALDPSNFGSGLDDVGESATPAPTLLAPSASPTSSPTPTPGPGSVRTLEQLLSWPYTDSGIAWPADNTVTAKDFPVFAASGLDTTILSSTNLTTRAEPITPDVVAPLAKGGTALISDASISAAMRRAATAATHEEWRVAMAEVSAQLALVGQLGDGTAPTVLVTLGRSAPSSSTRLADTLGVLDSLPWSSTVGLSAARASAPSGDVKIKDSPESAGRLQAVSDLVKQENTVADFATVLDDPTMITGQQRASLLTLLGTGWLQPGNDWASAASDWLAASQKLLNSIEIIVPDNYLFMSSTVNAQITISNKLGYPATVYLHASASNPRLEIGKSVAKTVEANSHAKATLPVEARRGNGRVTLYLSLTSASGVEIGHEVSVGVDVHADWEGIAAFTLGGLVVALFGFGIVRNILRRRKAKLAHDNDTDTDDTDDAHG